MSAPLQAPGRDLASLEGSLLQFLESGLSPPSRKVYAAAWRRYQEFVTAYSLTAHPISQENIALFITFLGQQGLAVATIESYLAGLKYYNLCFDPSNMFPSVYSPYIKLLLRGVQRAHSLKQPSLLRLPIMAPYYGSLLRLPITAPYYLISDGTA